MKPDYDVIIIGAGPAGAACAKQCVENNVRVLVLERSTLMRYKACAGLLSDRACDILQSSFGAVPESMICSPSRIRIKVSKIGTSYIEIKNQDLLSVRRHDFDNWLIEQSKAEVRERTIYRNHHKNTSTISLDITSGGKSETVTCQYLVGADGAWSMVRKNIDPNFDKRNLFVSKQVVYSGDCDLDPAYYYFLFNKKYSDLCCWFTKKDGLIYIGTTYAQDQQKDFFTAIFDKVTSDYNAPKLTKVRTESCLTDVRFSRDRFYFGRDAVMLIGEASGLLNNFGEGITAALNSGKMAAQAIVQAESSSAKANALYHTYVEAEKQWAIKDLPMRE